MALIIKPTGLCNFSCSFCSSGDNNIIEKKFNRVPDKIIDVIKNTKPSSIIITGGDPLMVDPSYYYHMREIIKCNISLTSNLKDFYYHPDKWVELFKEKWLNVVTSFQYGTGRKWDKNTVYDEKMFIEVYNMYKNLIDKPLYFISVIDCDNEDSILDLCKLAKKLNTRVKINNAEASGFQQYTYPRYKMFQHYINIFKNNLHKYTCYDYEDKMGCPFNISFTCKNNLRTCYIDKNNELHYFQCDSEMGNDEILIDYKNDIRDEFPTFPEYNKHVNENCWKCELFGLCNGCSYAVKSYPPEHCEEMLKLKEDLKKAGWLDNRKGYY